LHFNRGFGKRSLENGGEGDLIAFNIAEAQYWNPTLGCENMLAKDLSFASTYKQNQNPNIVT
jgi:hypothetical protein